MGKGDKSSRVGRLVDSCHGLGWRGQIHMPKFVVTAVALEYRGTILGDSDSIGSERGNTTSIAKLPNGDKG